MSKRRNNKPQGGRPPKFTAPAFPHQEVDRLLVHGEIVEHEDGQGNSVCYPSYRELAGRYHVAHSLIAAYSKDHNCLGRRQQAQQQAEKKADERLVELRAEQLAVSRDDQIRIVDRYMVGFEEALKEGRVRMDNPSDYNTLARLKAFLMGEADSRQQQIDGFPTLEELQTRHRAMLATLKGSTPEMRGEPCLGDASTEENTGSEEDEDLVDDDDDPEALLPDYGNC